MYHISRVWYLTLDCLTCEHIPCIACTTVGADLLSLESLHFVFWFSSIPKFTSKQLKKRSMSSMRQTLKAWRSKCLKRLLKVFLKMPTKLCAGGIIRKFAMQGHQGEEKATSTECYYTALHQKFTSKGRRRPDNTHDPNQSDCGGGSQHKEIG